MSCASMDIRVKYPEKGTRSSIMTVARELFGSLLTFVVMGLRHGRVVTEFVTSAQHNYAFLCGRALEQYQVHTTCVKQYEHECEL